jgi:hypothetical protein
MPPQQARGQKLLRLGTAAIELPKRLGISRERWGPVHTRDVFEESLPYRKLLQTWASQITLMQPLSSQPHPLHLHLT